MKKNIATDSLQSWRLLRCGVLADTADMSIRTITEPMIRDIADWRAPMLLTLPYGEAKDIYRGDDVVPAWSLSALLVFLPKEVFDKDGNCFYFSLAQEFPACDDYNAAYKPCWDDGEELVGKADACPIEACVQLIEWLAENDYMLNGTNEKERWIRKGNY